jgi:hypothetical protein
LALLVLTAEQLWRAREGSDMIVVLMRHRQNIDAPARVVSKVFDHFCKPRPNVPRAEDHTAVDQHAPRSPVLLRQRDEEAIAEALAVHPN